MKFDELFDQRNLVAMNLKNCIRDRGFTKISLAKKAKPKTVDVVYSENAPNDYQMNKKAQKQYGLLMDVLDLCEIYY